MQGDGGLSQVKSTLRRRYLLTVQLVCA